MSVRYIGFTLMFSAFILLGLSACNKDVLFRDTQSIDNGIWRYEDPKTFAFTAKDTLTTYNLLIEVKNDSRFPYQNLYLELSTELPGKKKVKDILSIDLADRSGNKYGACQGERCTFRIPVQQSFTFEETGPYEISISQHSRLDSLPGVLAIGLTIKETTTE